MIKQLEALRREDAQSTRECLEFAARKMGISEYAVAMTLSWFFEAVSERLSRGEIVTLPGFGSFGPMARSKRFYRDGHEIRLFNNVVPAWAANPELGLRVATKVSVDHFNVYRFNNTLQAHRGKYCGTHYRMVGAPKRPRSAARFRSSVRNGAREVGLEMPPE